MGAEQRPRPEVSLHSLLPSLGEMGKHRDHPSREGVVDDRRTPAHRRAERTIGCDREAHRSYGNAKQFLDPGGVIVGNTQVQHDDFVALQLTP